jgi:hypothetical protein
MFELLRTPVTPWFRGFVLLVLVVVVFEAVAIYPVWVGYDVVFTVWVTTSIIWVEIVSREFFISHWFVG